MSERNAKREKGTTVTCDEFVSVGAKMMAGLSTPSEHAAVARHYHDCADCRGMVDAANKPSPEIMRETRLLALDLLARERIDPEINLSFLKGK